MHAFAQILFSLREFIPLIPLFPLFVTLLWRLDFTSKGMWLLCCKTNTFSLWQKASAQSIKQSSVEVVTTVITGWTTNLLLTFLFRALQQPYASLWVDTCYKNSCALSKNIRHTLISLPVKWADRKIRVFVWHLRGPNFYLNWGVCFKLKKPGFPQGPVSVMMGRERELFRSWERKYFQEDYHSGLREMKSWKGDWCDFAKGFVAWTAISAHRWGKSPLYGMLYGRAVQIRAWLLLLLLCVKALLPINTCQK